MNKFFIILHKVDGREVAMMTECMSTSQDMTVVTLRSGKEAEVVESKRKILAMLKAVSKKAGECDRSPHSSFVSDFFRMSL